MCSVRNIKWRPIHLHTADNHMNYSDNKNIFEYAFTYTCIIQWQHERVSSSAECDTNMIHKHESFRIYMFSVISGIYQP